jgi:hypothetical protein
LPAGPVFFSVLPLLTSAQLTTGPNPEISHKKAHRGGESAKVVLRQRTLQASGRFLESGKSVTQTGLDSHPSATAKLWVVLIGGSITSDAGTLLLRQTDQVIGLTQRLAGCFHDRRSQELIEHSVQTLVGQRVFGKLSSRRLSVDFPATGAQFARRAASFPAITAITVGLQHVHRLVPAFAPSRPTVSA